MAEECLNPEESRKFAVLIARVWADQGLATQYQQAPEAVLAGAGISLAGRAVPEIPERPAGLASQDMVSTASFSSASSLSTVTCPCTGCTASCAGAMAQGDLQAQMENIVKMADDPKSREQARQMASNWRINLDIHP